MTNSTNGSSDCSWSHSASDIAAFISYNVVMPFHFVFGLFSYSLAFVSFYKKAKEEKAFGYQIIVTISESIEVITFAIYVALFYWLSGAENGEGAIWFRSSYGCMWFAAHFSFPLVNIFISLSMFLAVATAVDRAFALGKPLVYKQINRRRHHAIACTLCLIIAISSTVFDCFRFYPSLGWDGLYKFMLDKSFIFSLPAITLSHLRNAIRMAAAFALNLFNGAMIILYRRYISEVSQMTSTNSSESKRRHEQQQILLLAVFESVFNVLSMAALRSYYIHHSDVLRLLRLFPRLAR